MAATAAEGDEACNTRASTAEAAPATGGTGTTVYAWGGGCAAALGGVPLDGYGVCAFPSPVRGLPDDVVAVAAGEGCSAAVTSGGELYTWGAGRAGRLGHGDAEDRPRPTLVAALASGRARVAAVAVGDCHVVAVTRDGSAWSWGGGAHGALGDGGGHSRALPGPMRRASGEPVLDALPIIAAGSATSGVVCASGGLHTCGAGAHGRLGHGDTRDRNALVSVAALPAADAAVEGGGGAAVTCVAMGSVFSACVT